jgi:hypothetical protein
MAELRMIRPVVGFSGQQKAADVTPAAANREALRRRKRHSRPRDVLLSNLMTAQMTDGQSLLKKFRAQMLHVVEANNSADKAQTAI